METDFLETSDDRIATIAELLRRIALELRGVAQTVDDLQPAVGSLIAGDGARDAGAMRQLQNFDSLSQTLSGIADFTQALAAIAPDHWRLDPQPAARVVPLSGLADRLAATERRPALDAGAAGDVEIF
jgi:hypothetical protein